MLIDRKAERCNAFDVYEANAKLPWVFGTTVLSPGPLRFLFVLPLAADKTEMQLLSCKACGLQLQTGS